MVLANGKVLVAGGATSSSFLDNLNTAEVYDPAGGSWFLQYFAPIFVAFTLAVGYVAYRVVKDRDGAPDPADALVGKKN